MTDCPDHSDLLTCAQLRRLGRPVPELLAWLERDLGAAAMRRLAACRGGRAAEIPRDVDPAVTALGRDCGADVTAWLRRRFGHGRLQIPLGPASHTNVNLATCIRMLADGASVAETGAVTGLTNRTVTRIRRELRERAIDPSTFFDREHT